MYWLGYKWHVTETCDPGLPHLLINSDTVPAPTSDGAATDPIHHRLAERDLRPAEHLVDTAYLDAAQINTALDQHQITLIGPIRADTGWQNTTPDAYPASMFTIDWNDHAVTCPQGHTSHTWREETTRTGAPVTRIQFPARTCRDCPMKTRCTTSAAGRRLTLRPRAEHDTITHARAEQQTTDWQKRYNQRAGVEATIGQATGRFDLRHCRYRGLTKTRLQHLFTTTAINIARIDNWLTGNTPEPTRTSHIATLKPRAA
jgi:hypothetical protein